MAHPAPSAAREPAAIRLYLPSRKALAAVKAKVRTITGQTTNQPLAVVLHRLNWVLRGWANYFRHGASAKTFAYLDAFTWRRVIRWLCRKHQHTGWRSICRRWLPGWRRPREHHAVRPGHHRHPALPLPRRSDPLPMGGRDKIGGLTHLVWACGEPGA